MKNMSQPVGRRLTLLMLASSLGILCVLTAVSCTFAPPWDKPVIHWQNYDQHDGLVSGGPASETMGKGSRGFDPIVLEGGIVCSDFLVTGSGLGRKLFAVVLGPLVSKGEGDEVWKVAVAPAAAAPDAFLITTGVRVDSRGRIWAFHWAQILRSSDNGSTWELIQRSTSDPHPSGFQDVRFRGNEVWAACRGDGSLVRFGADDNRTTIMHVTDDMLWAVIPASDGRLFIGTSAGIEVSTNNGATFSSFYPAGIDPSAHLLELGGYLWFLKNGVVNELSPSGQLLWDSASQGLSGFSSMAVQGGVVWALDCDSSPGRLCRIDTSSGNQTAVTTLPFSGRGTVAADSASHLYVTYPGSVAILDELSSTWEFCSMDFSSVTLIQCASGAVWAGLLGGGLARLQDGASAWEKLGITDQVTTLCVRSLDEFILADPLVRSTDGGKTVTPLSVDPDIHRGECSIAGDSHGTVFLAGARGDFTTSYEVFAYDTASFGETWSGRQTVYAGSAFPRHPRLAVDEPRGVVWLTTEAGLFRRDIGGTARTRETGVPFGYDICVSSSGDVFFAGAWDGYELYCLDAAASTWTSSATPGIWKDDDLFVDDDGDVWIASVSGLMYSADRGRHRASYSTADGLASNYANAVWVQGSGAEKTIWVGTALGASRGTF
jgi:hypothetical protein